ncbi:MAG TPA: hypothetical protein VKF36_05885 [Syntrophorhabdales bacterium]|nr:hypothetical protein [Syntrophorhabdales bacterium]
MEWKVWGNISTKSGVGDAGKSKVHARYLMRSSECTSYRSNMGTNKAEIEKKWQTLEEADLAKRKDARFQTRIIFDVPNSISSEQVKTLMRGIQEKYFTDVNYMMVFHGGRNGMVPENRHFHIAFNTRSISTGKNDRTFKDRAFAQNFYAFIAAQLSRFGYSIVENPAPQKRNRVSRDDYLIRRYVRQSSMLRQQLDSIEHEIANLTLALRQKDRNMQLADLYQSWKTTKATSQSFRPGPGLKPR